MTQFQNVSNNKPNEVDISQLLARLRRDQLEAALAGRIDESAFFAGEARALRMEVDVPDTNSECAHC